MSLYHRDLGIPAHVRLWRRPLTLKLGPHAREQASRYAQTLPIPASIDPAQAVVIEVEATPAGKVVKTLYRLPYTSNSDLCVVCHGNGFVRTLWLNNRDDAHSTLDASKYTLPTER